LFTSNGTNATIVSPYPLTLNSFPLNYNISDTLSSGSLQNIHVTSIYQSAFSGYTGLTSIAIPSSVKTIGDNVFNGCTSLATVTFNSPLNIGVSAFNNTALNRVLLPYGTHYTNTSFPDTTLIEFTEAPPGPRDITGIDLSHNSVNLILTAFNQSITSDMASLLHTTVVPFTFDAVADISMSLQGFRDVFQFSFKDIALLDASDNLYDLHFYVNDASLSEIQYTVDGSSIAIPNENVVSVNPITNVNYKTGSTLSSTDQNVVSDYVRYLAKEIFGTVAGVDLFYNEFAVVSNLTTSFDHAWVMEDVSNVLLPISKTQATARDMSRENDGTYYYDNVSDYSGNNISRILFDQLITAAPSRFATATDSSFGLLLDVAHAQALPFAVGDTISWKLTISAAAGQEKIVDGTSSIGDRSYQIKMHLV
jgi:hypothetical protein